MPFSPPCSLSTQRFQRNSNSNGKYTCQDRRNRIVADIETNEAFQDRETNPTDFGKLERYIYSKTTENMLAEVAAPDQRDAKLK